jgi:hypothetical protein
MLLAHIERLAWIFTLESAGISIDISSAMIAITTSSSMRVKALLALD